LTEAEHAALHHAWRAIEGDPERRKRVKQGSLLASEVHSEAVSAAQAHAEFAWLATQNVLGDEAAFAYHDVRFGPTIAAIRAHAAAVVARWTPR
jgi:hypothetical protein